MNRTRNNSIFTGFLINSRFRVFRHLVLFVFVFFISSGMMWYIQEENMASLYKYIGLLFYMLIFLGCIYLNMYILTPKFLLKNKEFLYFSFLTGLVIFLLIVIVLSQGLFYEEEKRPIQSIDYLIGIITLLSSALSFILLFAGTTAFVLFKDWLIHIQRGNELKTITLQSELKLLENQINPHFLFNMLNNANIMIYEDPNLASRIVLKLEDMLRYQMNDSTKENVYLSEDIIFLTDYLELEKTRRDYFEYTISREGDVKDFQIPPLLFVTFVENAVKHNLDSEAFSYVHISFKMAAGKLIFRCENSVPVKPKDQKKGGLGLVNIKRRLDLLYSHAYSLQQTKTDTTYIVCLEIIINH